MALKEGSDAPIHVIGCMQWLVGTAVQKVQLQN